MSEQPLLTPTSVALSLSPPRCPPHGTVIRDLFSGSVGANRLYELLRYRDPSETKFQQQDDHDNYRSHTLLSRLSQLVQSIPKRPHPHLPSAPDLPDRITRFIGAILTLESQHSFRDGGKFRSVSDWLVTLSAPIMGLSDWRAARNFVTLSLAPEPVISYRRRWTSTGKKESGNGNSNHLKTTADNSHGNCWRKKKIVCGRHPIQFIHLFLPSFHSTPVAGSSSSMSSGDYKNNKKPHSENDNNDNISNKISHAKNDNNSNKNKHKTPVMGTIFFVHGGAWGAGHPWMNRLIAPAFSPVDLPLPSSGTGHTPMRSTWFEIKWETPKTLGKK